MKISRFKSMEILTFIWVELAYVLSDALSSEGTKITGGAAIRLLLQAAFNNVDFDFNSDVMTVATPCA